MEFSTLPPLYPPFRFGVLEEDVYRGAYPKERNYRFMKRLGLKTMIALVPDPPTTSLTAFCADAGISLIHLRTDKPKESSIPLTFSRVNQILQLLIDPSNSPVYIFCLDGTLVTNVITMCLRKLQGWSSQSYIAECMRYSKDDTMSSEEMEFVEKYTGDFEIVNHVMGLPPWLWGGQYFFKKHPTLKVRMGNPVNVNNTNPAVSAVVNAVGGTPLMSPSNIGTSAAE